MIPVIEGFRIIRPLGAGRSGTTYLASHEGKEVAAKCILRGDRVDEHVMREVFIQRALRSPYCVKLQQVILTSTHLVMVLDACKGGDLYTYLKERGGDGETVLPESLAWKILREVLLAVRYIHRRKIAHRDIKPENVLLNEPDIENSKNPCIVKLCDFGFSVVYEGPTVQPTMTPIVTAWTSPKNIALPSMPLSCSADSDESFGRTFDNHDKRLAVDIELEEVAKCTALAAVGTTAYVAPEVLDDDVPEYDPFAADIWSIGVLFYTMLTPYLPFQDPLDIGKSYKGMVERIKQGRYRRIRRGLVSEAAQNLLQRVFVVEPAERITLEEMIIIANEQIVSFSTSEVGMHKRSSEHYGKSGAFHGMSGVLTTALGSSPKRIAVPIPPPIIHNLSFEELRLRPADNVTPEPGTKRVEFAKGTMNNGIPLQYSPRGESGKNTTVAFAQTFSKGPIGDTGDPLSTLDTTPDDSCSKNPAAAFALSFSKGSIESLPEPTGTLPDLDHKQGESGTHPAAAVALSFLKDSIQVVDSQQNTAAAVNVLPRIDSKRREPGISAAATFAMAMSQGSPEDSASKKNMISNARNTSFAALFAQAATINDNEHCVDDNDKVEPLDQENEATNDSHVEEPSASIQIGENNNIQRQTSPLGSAGMESNAIPIPSSGEAPQDGLVRRRSVANKSKEYEDIFHETTHYGDIFDDHDEEDEEGPHCTQDAEELKHMINEARKRVTRKRSVGFGSYNMAGGEDDMSMSTQSSSTPASQATAEPMTPARLLARQQGSQLDPTSAGGANAMASILAGMFSPKYPR